jgi:hypothetical protein
MIILVGNGPSVMTKKHGALIDSFERVVRFNIFQIEGYEEYVGTRIDTWFTYWQYLEEKINWQHSFEQPETLVVWDQWRPPFAEHSAQYPRLLHPKVKLISLEDAKRVEQAYLRNKDEALPSTGLVAIILFKPCVIVGFDHFQASTHHYWDRAAIRDGYHNHEREREIVERFIAAGEVTRL